MLKYFIIFPKNTQEFYSFNAGVLYKLSFVIMEIIPAVFPYKKFLPSKACISGFLSIYIIK